MAMGKTMIGSLMWAMGGMFELGWVLKRVRGMMLRRVGFVRMDVEVGAGSGGLKCRCYLRKQTTMLMKALA